MLRKLFLILLAIWLPVQAGAALALSVGMPGLAQCHEQMVAATAYDHEDMGHHGHDARAAHAPDDGAAPHDQGHGAAGDCERCGLCQFVHGGVMLNAGAGLLAVPPRNTFAALGDEMFAAHIPDLLQRPPLSAA